MPAKIKKNFIHVHILGKERKRESENETVFTSRSSCQRSVQFGSHVPVIHLMQVRGGFTLPYVPYVRSRTPIVIRQKSEDKQGNMGAKEDEAAALVLAPEKVSGAKQISGLCNHH